MKWFVLVSPLALVGCGLTSSPMVPLYGAYFPAWLLSAALGIIASILVRMVFIRLGVDEGIPLRTLVYIALACLVAFLLAGTLFGH
ncbi:MAG: YtcA family lipoprotein [Halothiobacillaceae bacterium]